MYKQMTGLSPSQIRPHLYNACNDTVQHSLVNSHSTFFEMDESAMLEVIEKIVTKSVNPVVHQMHFGNLMQSEGESIKDFLVRMCSLPVDCEFSCPAAKHVKIIKPPSCMSSLCSITTHNEPHPREATTTNTN